MVAGHMNDQDCVYLEEVKYISWLRQTVSLHILGQVNRTSKCRLQARQLHHIHIESKCVGI